MKKSTIEVECEMPLLPNFITFKTRGGDLKLPVGQIQRKVLRQIGAQWVAALVKRGRRG